MLTALPSRGRLPVAFGFDFEFIPLHYASIPLSVLLLILVFRLEPSPVLARSQFLFKESMRSNRFLLSVTHFSFHFC
jgi:hypothetical protein